MARRGVPSALSKHFNAMEGWATSRAADEEDGIVKQDETLAFEFKIICLAAILFIYPVALCFELNARQSVTVFISTWMYCFMCACVPVWLLVCSVALLYRCIKRSHAAVWLILFPAVCLVICFLQQHRQFGTMSVQLLADGCETPSKTRFEEAFSAAQAVMHDCAATLSNITGAAPAQARQLIKVQDCAGYEDGSTKYRAEWRYFEYMERMYHCGGWCSAEWPVFNPAASVQDSCSLVAGRVLGGVAERMSRQVLVYSSVLATVALAVLFLMPGLVGAS